MNNHQFSEKTPETINASFIFSKPDFKKDLDPLLIIFARNDPQELLRYISSKSESFSKFDLNEESLLKLRQLSKYFSFV